MHPKIIIHPGFHKTGTTYLQRFLRHNGPTLWPLTALLFKDRLGDVIEAAKVYSYYPTPASLDAFKETATQVLSSLDLGLKRSLVVSAEGLSGVMPCRHGVADYGTSVDLHLAFAQCCRAVLGGRRSIHFLYTLRGQQAWLKSAHWQTIRATFSDLDWDRFQAINDGMIPLGPTVQRAKLALKPHQVHQAYLEDMVDMEFGPATPVIDLLGLNPAQRHMLIPIEDKNPSPPNDIVAACLEINRQDRNPEEKHAAKLDVIRNWRSSQ